MVLRGDRRAAEDFVVLCASTQRVTRLGPKVDPLHYLIDKRSHKRISDYMVVLSEYVTSDDSRSPARTLATESLQTVDVCQCLFAERMSDSFCLIYHECPG